MTAVTAVVGGGSLDGMLPCENKFLYLENERATVRILLSDVSVFLYAENISYGGSFIM